MKVNSVEIEWRLIPSLIRYEASNTGLIRNSKTLKILKPQNNIYGYYVMTCRPEPCKQINIRVHRAVAEAFLGKCPDGFVINHIDGDKHNNNIENLEYVTSSENNQHAIDTGLRKIADMSKVVKIGEENYLSKISEEQAVEILKYFYQTGYGSRKIAKHLDISRGIVDGIIRNRTWKHLDRDFIKYEAEREKELWHIA